MLRTSLHTLLLMLLSLSFALGRSLIVHERRDVPLRDAIDRRCIDPQSVLPIRIGLNHNEEASLHAETWLMSVSHPESPGYGRHWSQEEVIEAFKPTDASVQAVVNWLAGHGIHKTTHSDNKLWIAFDIPAYKAETMFQAEYFEHQRSNGRFEVSCDQYYLPQHLQQHVDYLTPGVKPSDITGRTSRSRFHRRGSIPSHSTRRDRRKVLKHEQRSAFQYHNSSSLARCDKLITPACIRALYGFSAPDPSQPVSSSNALGIFEEEDLYYQPDLDKFFERYTDIPVGTSPIFKPIDGGERSPNTTHGIGFQDVTGEAELDLQVALPIIYPQNATIFQTDDRYWSHQSESNLTFGIFNTFLDAIDGSYCTYSAFGETGNDPDIDPVYPDNRTHGYKGELQCGVYKPPNVVSFSYAGFENMISYAYQKRQCNEYLKLGLQGVSLFFSSGDDGVGPCAAHDRVFVPGQPNGCPWVTNVGATQIGRNQTVRDPEEAVSSERAGFTSGGGFSLIFDAPGYQTNAIAQYFQTANPPFPYFYNGQYRNATGRYNRNGRGIPDLAANGNDIATWTAGTFYANGGTSASAPLVASLFNRIVEERLRAGKGPLGFVNPTLYTHPEALNDVVSGHNAACGTKGFACAAGWDPVTGLGTPNYSKLLDVFMALP